MIIIGADHAGYELKEQIKDYLVKKNIIFFDATQGKMNPNDDYTKVAMCLAQQVLQEKNNLGIAICGTGLGIGIACNKIKGIRAVGCFDAYMAQMARKHNNANVICFGGRLTYEKTDVFSILDSFLNNEYEGGRHDARLRDINKLEDQFGEMIWK